MIRALAASVFLALTACAVAPDAPPAEARQPVNPAALQDLAAYVQSQKTTGFLVIQDGKTIAEHYWPLGGSAGAKIFRNNFVHGETSEGALREDVASQQKSVVALLVAIAVDKGLVDVETPVASYLGAGWSKASAGQEAAITIRRLLEMNSGLKEDLSFEAPAGATFFYNTPAYALLKPVLEKAAGESLRDLTRLWLTAPLAMNDTAWEQRPAAFANVGNPTGLVTTPRDLAKLGQLVLDRGKAPNGARVISETQLDAMFAPTAANPAYGRLWWLNNGDHWFTVDPAAQRRDGRFIAAAPPDTLSALGAQDRKLFVVPSMKLIVARTGQAATDRDFNETLWQLLMAAVGPD